MKNTEKNLIIIDVLKGTAVAIITLSIAVLIFAGLITATNLSNSVIKPINQFIKSISIFFGCFFNFKASKGYLKGLLTGILFAVVSYLLFALISGGASFGLPFIVDIIFCALVGMILGVLTISIRK